MDPARTEHPAPGHTKEHAHPSPREYVKIAVYLAIATALEIYLHYAYWLPNRPTAGLLLLLMVVKFALVAGWFMHLRFDSRLFRVVFYACIVLAIVVYTVALVTLGVLVRG